MDFVELEIRDKESLMGGGDEVRLEGAWLGEGCEVYEARTDAWKKKKIGDLFGVGFFGDLDSFHAQHDTKTFGRGGGGGRGGVKLLEVAWIGDIADIADNGDIGDNGAW